MAKQIVTFLHGLGGVSAIARERPVALQVGRWTSWLCAVVCIGLASCSAKPSAAPPETAGAASASDEMGEPHDQSSFAKDPSETHLMSPDEPDLHPEPGPGTPKARGNPGQDPPS